MRPGSTFLWIAGLYAVTSALACMAGERLIWNGTPSLPFGLYLRAQGLPIGRGSIVAFRVPQSVRRLVRERGYLPEGDLLLKRVVAIAGDRVCARGGMLLVKDQAIGPVPDRDSAGRSLPRFEGCGPLGPEQVFVMSSHPRSFDSRVFGAVEVRDLRGRVVPLWTYGPRF